MGSLCFLFFPTNSKSGGRDRAGPLAQEETEELRQKGLLLPQEKVFEFDSAVSSIPGFENVSTVQTQKQRFVVQKKATRSFRQSKEAQEQSFYVKFQDDNADSDEHDNDGDDEEERQPRNLADLSANLQVMFETLFKEVEEEYGKDGQCRIYMENSGVNFRSVIPPRTIGDLNSEHVMHHIGRVLHSARFVPVDDHLIISLGCVKKISGRGRRRINHLQHDLRAKRSVVIITNEDKLCLARAICVGLSHLKVKKNKGTAEERESKRAYDSIKRARSAAQRREAVDLLRQLQIPLDQDGQLSQVPKFERHLQVGITVIGANTDVKRRVLHNGDNQFKDRIHILYTEPDPLDPSQVGHFDTITTMTGLMCSQNYCNSCEKPYDKRGSHRCFFCCSVCGSDNCPPGNFIQCGKCNRTCRSMACLKRHQNGRNTFSDPECPKKWLCLKCKALVRDSYSSDRVKNHECGESLCFNCGEYYLNTHFCYMKQEKEKLPAWKFIFFDFECVQDDDTHEPILVVAQTSCSVCEDYSVQDLPKCVKCGVRCNLCSVTDQNHRYLYAPCEDSPGHPPCGRRRLQIYGDNCRDLFCQWLLSEQNMKAKVFAHNARSYDAYFLLAYLKDQGLKPDKIIMTGSKIMYMKMGQTLRIELLDSLNFLPMPLAAFPKSFDLTELKKGYFPHLFNTKANQRIVLPHLPAVEFYNPGQMSGEKRQEFLLWYTHNQHKPFNLYEEMLDYCISDVCILQEACMKFRKLMMDVTQEYGYLSVDPFCYITIASVCVGIFKTNFITEYYDCLPVENADKTCTHGYDCKCVWVLGRKKSINSSIEIKNNQGEWGDDDRGLRAKKFSHTDIATVPPHEYGVKGNHSAEAIEWLLLFQHQWRQDGRDISIQHARNGGEHSVFYRGERGISKYKLDGYFLWNGQEHALEFYGCHWHGCARCFPTMRDEPVLGGKSFNQLLTETIIREGRLERMNFVIHTMWECEFKRLMESKVEICRLMESFKVTTPLSLRECYFGGRTNAVILKKTILEPERGHYMDFTSLYPAMLKYKRYPVGHPKKEFNPSCSILEKECKHPRSCKFAPGCTGTHKKLLLWNCQSYHPSTFKSSVSCLTHETRRRQLVETAFPPVSTLCKESGFQRLETDLQLS